MAAATPQFSADDEQRHYFIHAIKGIRTDVAKSALQKAIRRSDLTVALYYAAVMLASMLIANLFNRLLVIASEDVGPADDCAVEMVVAAYDRYLALREADKTGWRKLRNCQELREMVYAVVAYMCRAEKSRMCDHACVGTICNVHDDPTTDPAPFSTEALRAALRARDLREIMRQVGGVSKRYGSTVVIRSCLEAELLPNMHPAIDAARIFADQHRRKSEKDKPFLQIAHAVYAICGIGRRGFDQKVPLTLAPDARADMDAIYAELVDPAAPMRQEPDYAYDDLHVFRLRGTRVKKGAVRKFVIAERDALSPKSSLPDPFFEVAATDGAEAREMFREIKRKEAAAAAAIKRKRKPVLKPGEHLLNKIKLARKKLP